MNFSHYVVKLRDSRMYVGMNGELTTFPNMTYKTTDLTEIQGCYRRAKEKHQGVKLDIVHVTFRRVETVVEG